MSACQVLEISEVITYTSKLFRIQLAELGALLRQGGPMAKTFMGLIRLTGDLLKGRDRVQWEATVLKNLNEIHSSRTGRAIFNQIRRSHRSVTIAPFYSQEVNAYSQGKNAKDMYYKGRPVRGGEGLTHEAKYSGGVEWGVGTGKGSDVIVRYTPWRFTAAEQAVTLLHELEHSAEQCQGVLFSNAIDWCFDTASEFDAILVENIFRSERGMTLRKDHHGWSVLKTNEMMVPQVDALKRVISSFRARLPLLAHELAKIDTPYNPLRSGAHGNVN